MSVTLFDALSRHPGICAANVRDPEKPRCATPPLGPGLYLRQNRDDTCPRAIAIDAQAVPSLGVREELFREACSVSMQVRSWGEHLKHLSELVDLWLRIRPPMLLRAAAFVIFIGSGLLVFSFNDWLFELLLEPVGFNRRGALAPILGFLPIALGLATLVADRWAMTIPSKLFEQDKALYAKIDDALAWPEFDRMLNNIHNHWYWSTEMDRMLSVQSIGENPSMRFSNGYVQRKWTSYKKAIEQLLRFLAQNFQPTPMDGARYKLIEPPDLHDDEQVRVQFNQLEKRFKSLIKDTDSAYKDLAKAIASEGLSS